ncbi:MAG: phosphoribosylanthranilate isomerase [Planctomycetes bacterium]|nr:phosphoribosylanthranilate isomerase [Planctomycetota bacterium]
MATWIKICGITCIEDALLAARLGANALGFVLHEASTRFCDPRVARDVITRVPPGVTTVGVWLDEPADLVTDLARFIGCLGVQTYDLSVARALRGRGLNVLPAIAAGDPNAVDAWRRFCGSWSGYVVVDGSRPASGRSAGAGAGALRAVGRSVAVLAPPARPVLAGGLNGENVYERLAAFRPRGVDVASGVEASPGRKDPERLTQFVEEVRRWDATVGSGGSADSSFPKP